jgi:hypothetical protein
MPCNNETAIHNDRVTKETNSTIFKTAWGRDVCSVTCTMRFNQHISQTDNFVKQIMKYYPTGR